MLLLDLMKALIVRVGVWLICMESVAMWLIVTLLKDVLSLNALLGSTNVLLSVKSYLESCCFKFVVSLD